MLGRGGGEGARSLALSLLSLIEKRQKRGGASPPIAFFSLSFRLHLFPSASSLLSFTHIFSSTMPLACDAPANGFFHSEPRCDFL